MKIGIDVDGVIIDSEINYRFYAEYWSHFKLGKDRMREDTTSQEFCFDWTDEEAKYFYNDIFDKCTKCSHIAVGAKEILRQLKKEGHQLYVITMRGYYPNEIKYTKKAFRKIGVKFDGIYYKTPNKFEKCKELGVDVMIEDSPEKIAAFVGSNIDVLYVREAKIQHINAKNVTEVDTWMDIYMKIQNLAKSHTNK